VVRPVLFYSYNTNLDAPFHYGLLYLPIEPTAPSGVSVTRVSETVIRVMWQPLSLVEARGHIRYRVMVTTTTTSKRKRQATQGERMCTLMSLCEVPANESSVLVGGLDRDTSYSVTVMAVNSENEDGPTSLPLIVTRKWEGGLIIEYLVSLHLNA